MHWLWPGAKSAPEPSGLGRNTVLLDRFAGELAELDAAETGSMADDDWELAPEA